MSNASAVASLEAAQGLLSTADASQPDPAGRVENGDEAQTQQHAPGNPNDSAAPAHPADKQLLPSDVQAQDGDPSASAAGADGDLLDGVPLSVDGTNALLGSGGLPQEDAQMGDIDVTNATPEQLAAFAVNFSAAFGSVARSGELEATPPSAPALPGAPLDSAGFAMEFARAAGNAEGGDAPMGGLSDLIPGPPPPAPAAGPEDGAEPAAGNSSAAPDSPTHYTNGGPSASAPAPEPSKKRRKAPKQPRAKRQKKDKSDEPKAKRVRKPRRDKYEDVTAEIGDDSKTLEAIGQTLIANDDKKKSVALTELFTRTWLEEQYIQAKDTEISRKEVYDAYKSGCDERGVTCLNESALGRAVRAVFPQVGTRRLGKRGESAYYYTGIWPKDKPLPESVPEASEAGPSEGASSSEVTSKKRRSGASRKSADAGSRSEGEPSRLLPAPAAYSTNPPQSIIPKPSVMPYAVSSARSGGSGTRASESWSSNERSGSNGRALRSGAAASSNVRTYLSDDDSEEGPDMPMVGAVPPHMVPPPPPAPPAGDAPGRETSSRSSSPADSIELLRRSRRRLSDEEANGDEQQATSTDAAALDGEGPSDAAASALFMLNQGVPPSGVTAPRPPSPAPPKRVLRRLPRPSAKAAAGAGIGIGTGLALGGGPSRAPARKSTTPSKPARRSLGPGMVAQRATSSTRVAPPARAVVGTSQSIFAPRPRDPDALARKPRPLKGKGKEKAGNAEEGENGAAAGGEGPDQGNAEGGKPGSALEAAAAAAAEAAAAAACSLNGTSVGLDGEDADGEEEQLRADVSVIQRSAEDAAQAALEVQARAEAVEQDEDEDEDEAGAELALGGQKTRSGGQAVAPEGEVEMELDPALEQAS
ncbi:hypothetical protein V8E36_002364 [Tilletia maclaganii]